MEPHCRARQCRPAHRGEAALSPRRSRCVASRTAIPVVRLVIASILFAPLAARCVDFGVCVRGIRACRPGQLRLSSLLFDFFCDLPGDLGALVIDVVHARTDVDDDVVLGGQRSLT